MECCYVSDWDFHFSTTGTTNTIPPIAHEQIQSYRWPGQAAGCLFGISTSEAQLTTTRHWLRLVCHMATVFLSHLEQGFFNLQSQHVLEWILALKFVFFLLHSGDPEIKIKLEIGFWMTFFPLVFYKNECHKLSGGIIIHISTRQRLRNTIKERNTRKLFDWKWLLLLFVCGERGKRWASQPADQPNRPVRPWTNKKSAQKRAGGSFESARSLDNTICTGFRRSLNVFRLSASSFEQVFGGAASSRSCSSQFTLLQTIFVIVIEHDVQSESVVVTCVDAAAMQQFASDDRLVRKAARQQQHPEIPNQKSFVDMRRVFWRKRCGIIILWSPYGDGEGEDDEMDNYAVFLLSSSSMQFKLVIWVWRKLNCVSVFDSISISEEEDVDLDFNWFSNVHLLFWKLNQMKCIWWFSGISRWLHDKKRWLGSGNNN